MTPVEEFPLVAAARWLEDGESARTRAWVDAQDAQTQRHLDSLPPQQWVEDLVGDTIEHAEPAAWQRHGAWLLREERDPAHPHGGIVGRCDDAPPRTVFAPPADPPTTVSVWRASPDGGWLAVQVVVAGREATTPLHLVPLDGRGEATVIQDVRHTSLSWVDDHTLVYVRCPASGPERVVVRDLDTGRERTVAEAAAPGLRCQVRVWHRRWVTVAVRRGTAPANQLLWADLRREAPQEPQWVQADAVVVTVGLVDVTGALLLVTNDEAPHGRLVRPGPDPSDRTGWRTVLRGTPRSPLTAADIVRSDGAEHLVVVRRQEGRTLVSVHDPVTVRSRGRLALPGPGLVTVGRAPTGEGEPVLRYTDWVTPPTDLEVDARNGVLRLAGEARRDLGDLRFEQHRCVGADGVEVPYLWLGPADADRPLPTLVTVYGGFGRSVVPTFQPDNVAWVRAGGAMVLADVRGGGGHDSAWHRAGVREHKQRSIDDLHTVVETLVREGRAAADRVVLLGSSHGGLLVTAALVQRPELYAAGVAVAPLTDMEACGRSGLGPAWVEEFGSVESPRQRAAMLAYSPCHRVRPGRRYPPLLLVTGDNDTRVDPLHARKLVAVLQAADPAGGPFLLRRLRSAGHQVGALTERAAVASATFGFLGAHAGLGAPTNVG
jgi:prolyl oligopeptidase